MRKLIFMLLLSFSLYGQKYDNIWPMGYKYDSCNYYIDFTDSFEIVPTCLGLNFVNISNSSICDSFGSLLFYSNGNAIADRSHEIMLNGTAINNTSHPDYIDGYPSKTLIVQKPNSLNLFYLFHSEYPTNFNGQISYGNAIKFNYSLIDMNFNNGDGEVIMKNIPILNDTIGGGGNLLTACKHANGQDWWILLPKYNSNVYYRFLIAADSVYGPYRQELGYSFSGIDWSGQDVFSPDGSLYVRYDPQNQAHLYNFNRCTGELSYRQQINVPSNSNAGGAAISSNSRFLYITNDTIVFQYDLEAADINASRVIVAIYDGFMSPGGFWQMQLAPNGKIFAISPSTDRLHVIENPDSAGLTCNFRQHAIVTPRYNGLALPNFPHFRTPALASGACDTTGVAVLAVVKERIKIYPNPAQNYISIELQSEIDAKIESVEIFNLNGQKLKSYLNTSAKELLQIELESLSEGMYICRVIMSDNSIQTLKFSVIK